MKSVVGAKMSNSNQWLVAVFKGNSSVAKKILLNFTGLLMSLEESEVYIYLAKRPRNREEKFGN